MTAERIPFVAVGDGEAPPWGDDRTCPTCGEPDLPLQDSTPPGLSFISHCGGTWLRGPIKGHPVTPETPTAGAETGPGAPNEPQTCNYPSSGPEPSGGRTANEEGQ